VLLLLWQAIVSLTGISPYIAKGPLDVDILVTAPKARANRAQMFPLVGQTLLDAWIGFVVGMLVAIILSIAFSLSKAIEAGVMPLVLLLRTIPLVSIAPVIILHGTRNPGIRRRHRHRRGSSRPWPTMLFGLSRASQQSLDVVHVFGGGRFTALRKVNLPGAVVRRGARVGAGAVTGALAEWLSTGTASRIDPEVQRAGAVRPAVDLDRAHHADHARALQPRADRGEHRADPHGHGCRALRALLTPARTEL
jgi:hypothetical protein